MDERDEIKELLPTELAYFSMEHMVRAVMKEDALGGKEFAVFRRASWDKSYDTDFTCWGIEPEVKPKWTAACRCGSCGYEWHSGWKDKYAFIAVTDEVGEFYPGIPDDEQLSAEIEEGELFRCPFCGNMVAAVSKSSLKNGRTYQCLMGQLINIGEFSAVMYWMLRRMVSSDASSKYDARPWAAVVVGRTGKIWRFVHTSSGMYGKREYDTYWKEAPRSGEPIRSRYYSWEACNKTMMGGFYVTDIPDPRGKSGEKTGLSDYIALGGEFPLAYLLRARRRKGLENLVRAGWVYTIDDAINAEISQSTVQGEYLDKIADFSLVRPHKMLRMTRDEVERFGHEHWSRETAELWKLCEGLTPDEFRDLLRRYNRPELRAAYEQFGAKRLRRADRYLRGQERRGGIQANGAGMAIYRDYLAAIYALGGTEEEPKNLRRAHDRWTEVWALQKNQAKFKEGFERVLKTWGALEWSDGEICAVLPRDNAELVIEGKRLNHCVGGYGDRHTGGKLVIFIRHARRPERSWFTLNIDVTKAPWEEIQLHGYGNEWAHCKRLYIPKKVRAFVDRWEAEVLTPVFKKVSEARRKQNKKARAAA